MELVRLEQQVIQAELVVQVLAELVVMVLKVVQVELVA